MWLQFDSVSRPICPASKNNTMSRRRCQLGIGEGEKERCSWSSRSWKVREERKVVELGGINKVLRCGTFCLPRTPTKAKCDRIRVKVTSQKHKPTPCILCYQQITDRQVIVTIVALHVDFLYAINETEVEQYEGKAKE